MADHQKLNAIQKQAFHFFGWRGVVMETRPKLKQQMTQTETTEDPD